MNHQRLLIQRLFIQRFGAACVLTLAVSLLAAAQQPAAAAKTAGQVYKNLHVLQDMPADQFTQAMRNVAGSLGVECGFCHVRDRSQDDLQTKRTAREMMTMVLGINKNSFGGQLAVTCYTCHRGNSGPVSIPVLPEVNGIVSSPPILLNEAAGASKPALPTADDILAKYVQALGGEQALRKVTSRVITATDDIPTAEGGLGPTAPVDAQYYFKAPNLVVQLVHTPGTVEAGFDGSVGWTQDAKGVVRGNEGTDGNTAQRDNVLYDKRNSDFYENLDLKKEYSQLQVRSIEKVHGRDAYMVVGTLPGQSPERLYFDAQTGLLVRKWRVIGSMLGNSPVVTDYDDYRDAGDGVKIPFLIKTAGTYPSQNLTIHVTKVQDNAPIDASKFTKPESKSN